MNKIYNSHPGQAGIKKVSHRDHIEKIDFYNLSLAISSQQLGISSSEY